MWVYAFHGPTFAIADTSCSVGTAWARLASFRRGRESGSDAARARETLRRSNASKYFSSSRARDLRRSPYVSVVVAFARHDPPPPRPTRAEAASAAPPPLRLPPKGPAASPPPPALFFMASPPPLPARDPPPPVGSAPSFGSECMKSPKLSSGELPSSSEPIGSASSRWFIVPSDPTCKSSFMEPNIPPAPLPPPREPATIAAIFAAPPPPTPGECPPKLPGNKPPVSGVPPR
mmetsp:Transcript_965/g.4091  ORF Transcript_965/g.4091 Transcript_965/m.4091 type:complete len:233 (+) Transcript_965:17-715(+)